MALGITINRVAEVTGLSRRQVRITMRNEEVRFKRLGNGLLLDPDDVDRVFGFAAAGRADSERKREDLDIFRTLRDDR